MPNEKTTDNAPTDAETPVNTQAPSGKEGNNATPEAETSGESSTYSQDQVERIIKERLDRAQKKWETEKQQAAEEAAKRAKMDELERAKAEKEDLQKQLEEERAARTRAQREAELAGKVTNPKRLLALMEAEGTTDELTTENGALDVEAALGMYPEYAPGKTSVGASSRPANDEDPGDLPTQIRKAEEAGDWQTSMRLKNQLMRQKRATS